MKGAWNRFWRCAFISAIEWPRIPAKFPKNVSYAVVNNSAFEYAEHRVDTAYAVQLPGASMTPLLLPLLFTPAIQLLVNTTDYLSFKYIADSLLAASLQSAILPLMSRINYTTFFGCFKCHIIGNSNE